jgi:hypothetical protein
MLAVFIEELGGEFAPYVEDSSKLLLSLISYEANDSIRNSVAGALPGLVKCIKEVPTSDTNRGNMLVEMGRTYLEALWKGMQSETETDTLIC